MSILETLLAPKTLWTDANLLGSCGEKYGENGHWSVQRRRRSLQAAHGVIVFSMAPCSDGGAVSKSRLNLLLVPSSCLSL